MPYHRQGFPPPPPKTAPINAKAAKERRQHLVHPPHPSAGGTLMNVGQAKIGKRPPLFGQILLEQGKITLEVLDAALARQAEQRLYIGEILCQLGHIRPADIEEA